MDAITEEPREGEKGARGRNMSVTRPHFRVRPEKDRRVRTVCARQAHPGQGPTSWEERRFHIEAAEQSRQRALGRLKIFHWIQQFRRYRNPFWGGYRFPQSRGSRKETGIPVWERAKDSTHSLATPSQAIPPPNANPITHTPASPQVPGLRRPGGALPPQLRACPCPCAS